MTWMRGRGTTLPEVIIGLLILGVLGAGFINFLRGSRNELEFGAEHFTGLLLTQKVIEDCYQEMTVNPQGLETLGIENGNDTPSGIRDGESVFFSTIEDRNPPWGRIDPVTDGAISKKWGPLYDQVRDFKLQVKARRLEPGSSASVDQNLVQADVTFSWEAGIGLGEYQAETWLFAPLTPKAGGTGLSVSQADVEREAVLALLLEPGKNIDQVLAEKGGNKETILAWARLQLLTNAFMESTFLVERVKSLEKDQIAIRSANLDQPNLETLRLVERLASDTYDLAREAFRFIREIQPDAERVMADFNPENLGYLWKQKRLLANGATNYRRLLRIFSASLYWAKVHLETLLEKPLVQLQDKKQQFFFQTKVIALYRLLLLLPDSPVKKDRFTAFFTRLRDYSDGVQPAMFRWAGLNLSMVDDPSRMKEKDPNLAAVSAITARFPEQDRFFEGPSQGAGTGN